MNWCSKPNNEFILEIFVFAIWPSAADQKTQPKILKFKSKLSWGIYLLSFLNDLFIYFLKNKTQLLALF